MFEFNKNLSKQDLKDVLTDIFIEIKGLEIQIDGHKKPFIRACNRFLENMNTAKKILEKKENEDSVNNLRCLIYKNCKYCKEGISSIPLWLYPVDFSNLAPFVCQKDKEPCKGLDCTTGIVCLLLNHKGIKVSDDL